MSTLQSPTTPQFGFTGQRFEQSVGIYNYGARWYDPAIGRFLQADSMVPDPRDPQSLNRYAYTRNNPVSRLDPSGHSDFNWTLWDEGSSDEPDWETFSANVETFTFLTWFVDPSFSYSLALLNGAGISASASSGVGSGASSAGASQPASLGTQLAGLGAGLAVGAAAGSVSTWALGEAAAAIACPVCGAAVAAAAIAVGGYQVYNHFDSIRGAFGDVFTGNGTFGETFEVGLAIGGFLGGAIEGLAGGEGPSVAGEGPLNTAYRYVGPGEASIIEKTGLVPNVTRLGQPKNVSLTPLEFRSASEAEEVLAIGRFDPRGAGVTPTHGVEVDLQGVPLSYGGTGAAGVGGIEVQTQAAVRALRIFELGR